MKGRPQQAQILLGRSPLRTILGIATFCIPDFELFVAGRSGSGAVDDNRRLCEFLYRNLGTITQVFPSLDTHHAMQIFHAIWLVDEDGGHPSPYALISADDVAAGRWRVNHAVAKALDTLYGHLEDEPDA